MRAVRPGRGRPGAESDRPKSAKGAEEKGKQSPMNQGQEEAHILEFVCKFCGNRWRDEYPIKTDEVIALPGCRVCVPDLEPGVLVRYGSPERAPGDAMYADNHLKRGELYTIARVKRWQHGSYVSFRETGDRQFNSRLFVPADFYGAIGTS